jgi:hypothetical protein
VTDAPFWETSIDPDPGIANVPALDSGVLAFPSGLEIVGKVEQVAQLIAQQIALALDGISFLGINPFLALQQFGKDPGAVISTILIALGGGGTGLTGLATAMGDVGAVVSDVTQLTAAFGTTGIADVIDAIQLTQALSNAIENALEGGDATTADAAQVQAALSTFLSNNTEAIGAAQQTVLNVIANGLGQPTGTNYTPTQVEGFVADIPGDAEVAAQSVVQALENGLAVALGLPATAGVNYTVAQIQAQLEDQLASFLLLSTWQSFINAIVGGTTGTATQLFTILSNAVTGVVDLETQLTGFSPSSVISQLIALFPGTASGLSGLTGLGGIFSDLLGFVGSPTGLGSGSPASAVAPTSVPALRGLFSGGTFLSSLIPNLNADIITAGTLASSLIQGIEGAGTTLVGDVTNIVEGAGAATAAEAGTIISGASGAIADATNVLSGAVPTAVTSFGSEVGSLLGGLFGGLTGGAATSASSAQVQSAAQAVAAAQAAQAQETAAINAQLPKFYGGSGTSGLNAQVEFSGSLPSSFTQPAAPTSSGSVAFDAAGSGGSIGSGSASSLSGTHDGTAAATALAYVESGGTVSSITIGSASGTLLESIPNNNDNGGILSLFKIPDIPGGEQTVEVTLIGDDNATFETVSYTGVTSIGTPFTTFGFGTALSQAIACASGQIISHAFGIAGSTSGDVSGGTERFQASSSLIVQDSPASATFAATASASTTSSVPVDWSGIGVVLSAAASSATISRFTALFDQAADTDQETVSGIWSSPITVNGGARYLFLRVNSGFSSYLFVKWFATGNTSAPVFNVSLGCVVAGVEHVFATFTESTAATAQALINASANNNIGLEATADAISFTYPQGASTVNASIAFSDTSGVSQIGATFRNAGFGTDESPVVFPASWAFFDSGPTSGPQASPIITPQTSLTAPPTGAQTTTSTTFAELATTTDQVTVNIGPSGIALVFLSCDAANSAEGGASYVSFAMSGENTAAASFSHALVYQAFLGGGFQGFGNMFPQTGLNPGATTFKMEYAVSADTGTFWNRSIFVLPI